jgi:hypothetical protein
LARPYESDNPGRDNFQRDLPSIKLDGQTEFVVVEAIERPGDLEFGHIFLFTEHLVDAPRKDVMSLTQIGAAPKPNTIA